MVHVYLYFDSCMLKDSVMKNIQNLFSDGPKPKGDVVQQLLDLKEWSQNPERYERRLNFRAGQAKKKEQAEALKNSKKWIDNPKKLEAFIKSEDPVLRNAKEKQIKVAKKPLPKDWQPKYLNGNVIDITPLIDDSWLLIKPEPEDEDTSIPIEEKINKRIAKQKRSEGLAYLLGETI